MNLQKTLLIIIVLLSALHGYADDDDDIFEYQDGTFTYQCDKWNQTATILSGAAAKGDVRIPASIEVNDDTYYDDDDDGDHVFTVLSIGDNAFKENANITSVSIPSSVHTIGISAFLMCTNLVSVSFEDALYDITLGYSYATNGQGTIYASVFYGCNALTNVFIGRNIVHTDNVAYGVFESSNGFPALNVSIGKYVTSLPQKTFQGAPLTSLDLDAATSLTTMKAADFGTFASSKLTSVKFPSTVTTIESGVFKEGVIQNAYFAGGDDVDALTCPNIFSNTTYVYLDRSVWRSDKSDANITFPACKTLTLGNHLKMVEYYQFNGSTSLKYLYGVTNNKIEIRPYAFQNCAGITELSLFSPLQIDSNAFKGCTGLESIMVTENTTIQKEAFSGCTNIANIYVDYSKKADPQIVDDGAFEASLFNSTTLISQVGDYDANCDYPWKNFLALWYDPKDKLSVDTQSETEIGQSTHDVVSMQFAQSKCNAAMLSLPFNVNSYYFGADAEVYVSVQVDGSGSSRRLSFSKYDIDAHEYLPTNTALLICTPHGENTVRGTVNLFTDTKINVNPKKYSKSYANGGSQNLAVDAKICSSCFVVANTVVYAYSVAAVHYVIEDGYIKRVNSTSYVIPAFNATITDYKGPHTLEICNYDDSYSKILEGGSSVTPNQYLEGYTTFYSETSNFEIYNAENGGIESEVYTVSMDEISDGKTLKLTRVSDGVINKGQAVLIKANAGTKLKLRMVTNGSADTEAYATNKLKGVSADTSVSDLCANGYSYIYVLSCNSSYENVGFYQYSTGKTLGAGKAYLDASEADTEAKALLLPTPTNIGEVESSTQTTDASRIYDLNGRKANVTKSNSIYIINNNKILKK